MLPTFLRNFWTFSFKKNKKNQYFQCIQYIFYQMRMFWYSLKFCCKIMIKKSGVTHCITHQGNCTGNSTPPGSTMQSLGRPQTLRWTRQTRLRMIWSFPAWEGWPANFPAGPTNPSRHRAGPEWLPLVFGCLKLDETI